MMYIIQGNFRHRTSKRLEVIGVMHAAILQIRFFDGVIKFQQGINSVVKNLLDGDELFIDSPTKEELDIGKQLLYTLFKFNK